MYYQEGGRTAQAADGAIHKTRSIVRQCDNQINHSSMQKGFLQTVAFLKKHLSQVFYVTLYDYHLVNIRPPMMGFEKVGFNFYSIPFPLFLVYGSFIIY